MLFAINGWKLTPCSEVGYSLFLQSFLALLLFSPLLFLCCLLFVLLVEQAFDESGMSVSVVPLHDRQFLLLLFLLRCKVWLCWFGWHYLLHLLLFLIHLLLLFGLLLSVILSLLKNDILQLFLPSACLFSLLLHFFLFLGALGFHCL